MLTTGTSPITQIPAMSTNAHDYVPAAGFCNHEGVLGKPFPRPCVGLEF